VCPTGIDIRNGLQYQCIGCAACIDVCDEVMDKMNYPKGLIRYTTENVMSGKGSHILRPRIVIYATILIAFIAGFAYSLSQRIPLKLDIIRDRNSLYRETEAGLVENVYTLKLINMDNSPHRYTLSVAGLPELEVDTGRNAIEVAAGEVLNLPIRVRTDPINLKRASNEISFTLSATDAPELTTTQTGRFIGPAAGAK
jgi:cytochrome c oxidase accessory protein FixG